MRASVWACTAAGACERVRETQRRAGTLRFRETRPKGVTLISPPGHGLATDASALHRAPRYPPPPHLPFAGRLLRNFVSLPGRARRAYSLLRRATERLRRYPSTVVRPRHGLTGGWPVPRNVAEHAGITRRGRGAARGRAALVGRDDGSVHSAAAGGAAGYACRRVGSGSGRRARAAGVRRVMVRLPGLQEAHRAARGFLRPVRAKVGLHPLGRPIGQYVASGRSQLSARRIPRRRELRHDRPGKGDG